MKHAHVDDTLTQCERDARLALGNRSASERGPFQIAEPDPEPLEQPTRTGTVWCGAEWTEHDAETGRLIARGRVGLEDGTRQPAAGSRDV